MEGDRHSFFSLLPLRQMVPRSFFDVAAMYGHGAMRQMTPAWKLEQRIGRLEKEVQKKIDEGTYWKDFRAGTEKRGARRQQIELLCMAVILFHSSMETIANMAYADPHDMYPNSGNLPNRPGDFEDNWRTALNELGESTDNFDTYHEDFYFGLRCPLIHAGTEDDIETVRRIDFEEVYCGIRAGWRAYGDLLNGLGRGPTPDSWEILCDGHNIPHDLFACT